MYYSVCGYGPAYSLSTTAHVQTNGSFYVSYADGDMARGPMAMEDVQFGGIEVTQQRIGLATQVSLQDDKSTSGIIGLGLMPLTSNYVPGQGHVPYSTLFETMVSRGLVEQPIFAFAIDRPRERTAVVTPRTEHGGYMSLGGIDLPNVDHKSENLLWTRMLPINQNGIITYFRYQILVDGYVIRKPNSSLAIGPRRNSSERLWGAPSQTLVDTGTSLMMVPRDVLLRLANSFDPPAQYYEEFNLFLVACSAMRPTFGVSIGGRIFDIDELDLVSPWVFDSTRGRCRLNVMLQMKDHLPNLGLTFLRNVVAVYDLGQKRIGFEQRSPY